MFCWKYPEVYYYQKKVLISQIIVDKKYIWNNLDEKEVEYIISNFYIDAWEPIWINENNFLLDGQHRLEFAKRMELKYIDVRITNQKNEKNKWFKDKVEMYVKEEERRQNFTI